MSFELIHTSVEKGLRGGTGFATAVATRGLPSGLEGALEELSAYDFEPTRAVGADRIDHAHRIVTVQGRSYSVLSRVSPCGNDWSGRPNRIAHHVVLDPSERAAAGPAWMLANMPCFADEVPATEERPFGPSIRSENSAERRATAWPSAGFDVGWAGVVAKTLLDMPQSPCYLVLPPDSVVLPLLEDLFGLLPDERRWHITFSTRYLRTPATSRCQLRCVRKGARAFSGLLAEPGVQQIAVEVGSSAGGSASAVAAREGRSVTPSVHPSTRVVPVMRKQSPTETAPIQLAPDAPREIPALESQSESMRSVEAFSGADAWRSRIDQPARASGTPRQLPQQAESRLLAYVLFGVAGVAIAVSAVLIAHSFALS
ncbi:MAG: hypothetical protein EXS10_09145 [Phycisphaerales bacterium]|nr:hypothetical protein [Phycisphaerales bacterium]